KLQCLGSTTRDGFRAYLAGDTALAERFEPVEVARPTVQDIVAILRRVKALFERYHGLEITDDALQAAAEEAVRLFPGAVLPDVAIDLIDQAATEVHCMTSSEAILLKDARRRLGET